MNKRINRLTATHVDLAVNVAAAFNLAAGVRAMHEQGVCPAVVQRVLIERGPRRGARPSSVPSSPQSPPGGPASPR